MAFQKSGVKFERTPTGGVEIRVSAVASTVTGPVFQETVVVLDAREFATMVMQVAKVPDDQIWWQQVYAAQGEELAPMPQLLMGR